MNFGKWKFVSLSSSLLFNKIEGVYQLIRFTENCNLEITISNGNCVYGKCMKNAIANTLCVRLADSFHIFHL